MKRTGPNPTPGAHDNLVGGGTREGDEGKDSTGGKHRPGLTVGVPTSTEELQGFGKTELYFRPQTLDCQGSSRRW